MGRDIEDLQARMKRLEDAKFRDIIRHKHCVDCGVELVYRPDLIHCSWIYEGRVIPPGQYGFSGPNSKPHCENCAKLHDPPPPKADHTHEEKSDAKISI